MTRPSYEDILRDADFCLRALRRRPTARTLPPMRVRIMSEYCDETVFSSQNPKNLVPVTS